MKMIRQFKDLSVFLISVFFAMAGIYIVVAFAFIYGDQVVGWDDSVRVLMFVIVQITAAAGAFAFGLIQDRIGSRVTYMLTLGLWFFAVLGIWGVGGLTSWLNSTFQTTFEAQDRKSTRLNSSHVAISYAVFCL